jgi:uncharacterized protein
MFHVMTKPIGPICNLDCRYCFYLEKEELYPREQRERSSWRMPDEVLESYVRQYIEAQDAPEVSFAWQGGEPTLLGVDFFEKVVALQRRYAGGKRITNALQTNGTLLDDAWGAFLAEQNFLVGISIDGPKDLHDCYRVDKRGRPSFEQVLRGLEVLQRHRVAFNTLTVVHRRNAREPQRVYRFLKEIGSGFLQFIPLVEREATAPLAADGALIPLTFAPPTPPPGPLSETERGNKQPPVTEWSVRAEEYGQFLVTIFEEWVRRDVGRVFVQLFDVALGNWSGLGASLCYFKETCGAALAIEHNGDVYACDHYVYPEYRLGNLMQEPLAGIVAAPEQQRFGREKRDTLPRFCRECDVRFACHGECPKHRFLRTPDGEWGLNYLCAGYKRFFRHIDPYMREMSRLVWAGRAPAEIMAILEEGRRGDGVAPPRSSGPGRNDPCPCGSGRKYKACCLSLGGAREHHTR